MATEQDQIGFGTVRINILNAGSMRLGEANAMNGNQGSGSGQTVTINRITTIDDPNYDIRNTRVFYTNGTHQDFEWEGQITRQTTVDAGLYVNYEWTEKIQEVHFGTNVSTVVQQAFAMNPTISNVTFEEGSNATISDGAFSECPNLADSSGFAVIDRRLVSIDPSKLGANVTVPTSTHDIEYLEPYCFVNYEYSGKVVNVTIPGIVTIRGNAFGYCNYIQELHLPNMSIADIENDYANWGLGEEYSELSPDPTYRAITIYCSDGTIVQDTSGSWNPYPNE